MTFPETMDFLAHRESTLAALTGLRYAILTGGTARVMVDLSRIQFISDAAAVVLAAELKRCLSYARNLEVRGNYPAMNSSAIAVLTSFGVFEHLELPAPPLGITDERRRCFRIVAKDTTDSVTLGGLAEHFVPFIDQYITTDPAWKRQLYKALIDAASNTAEHAYSEPTARPWLQARWWAAGIVNEPEKFMRFVFWDQGLGIPHTIRRSGLFGSIADELRRDHGLIEQAVQKGYSRHRKNPRRGHGLSVLIELIRRAPHGVLEIHSGRGTYEFRRDSPPATRLHTGDIGGTLLVWTVHREPL